MKVREYKVEDEGDIARVISELRSKNNSGEITSRVSEIIDLVKQKGDEELLRLTRKFDSTNISNVDELLVTEEEIRRAFSRIDPGSLKALKIAARQIQALSKNQISRFREIKFRTPLGFLISEMYMPFKRVGGYVPGGLAAYPSTVLMICVPAREAGVKEIVLASPPVKDGSLADSVIVAASLGGASQIFKLGGAQAIAAMAVGTSRVVRVDLIVGPGNEYVTEAKRQVSQSGEVLIDSLAGPTELLIVADESARPEYIAEDLISQAEHGNRTICGLVSTSGEVVDSVVRLLGEMTGRPREEHINRSILFTVHVPSPELLIEFSQSLAPEHLEVMMIDPKRIAGKLSNAGLVLLGNYAPCAASDYVVGTNHVLPTGGSARWYPGLGVERFLKRRTVVSGSRKSLATGSRYISNLASLEGFPNHTAAPLSRFTKDRRRKNQ